MDIREKPADPEAAAERIRRDSWRAAAVAVVLSRLLFLAAGWAGVWMLGARDEGPALASILSRWDAPLLLGIAEHGYTSPASDAHAAAFFPLFPLAVKAVALTGIGSLAAALVVNAAASLVAFAFLYRIAETEYGAGRRAVAYLAVFPTAVFLTVPYSEALFLAGAVPAFWYARQGRWDRVGLPAAVAMGSRFAGVFLVAGLAAEAWIRRDVARTQLAAVATAFAAALAPLAAYVGYLWAATEDPLLFVEHQHSGWGRTFVGPVRSFWTTWNTWGGDYPLNWRLAWRIEILAAAAGAAFVVWAIRRREWGYATFAGVTVAVLVTSTWYFSIPRMLLGVFPIVLLLASWSKGRAVRHEIVLVGFASAATIGAVVYARGGWFF